MNSLPERLLESGQESVPSTPRARRSPKRDAKMLPEAQDTRCVSPLPLPPAGHCLGRGSNPELPPLPPGPADLLPPLTTFSLPSVTSSHCF